MRRGGMLGFKRAMTCASGKFSVLIVLMLLTSTCFATEELNVTLQHAPINLDDKASLQRGARVYMNYCSGCHSLTYMRYRRMAKDIGIVDKHGKVLKELVVDNLIFNKAKLGDPIKSSMPAEAAKEWFGITPPDLSLITRVRGTDWVYSYLKNFYFDSTRPWGTNNLLFPDTAMPNVLAELQGEQVPLHRTQKVMVQGLPKEIVAQAHLILVKNGTISPEQFDATVVDLVNFLTYVGEPMRSQREHLGIWVIAFLVVLSVLLYFLKREFWRDIKK